MIIQAYDLKPGDRFKLVRARSPELRDRLHTVQAIFFGNVGHCTAAVVDTGEQVLRLPVRVDVDLYTG